MPKSTQLSLIKKLLARLLRKWGPRRNNEAAGWLFDSFEGTYQLQNCSFEVPRNLTTRGFRSRFFFRIYEQDEVALIEQHVAPDDVVLEIGGCLGVISCLTNRRLARPEQHVVVEANPQLIPWLKRNRTRNDCAFRVEHGLVSKSSDGTFFLHPLIVGGSANRRTDRRISVPVHSYEELEDRTGLNFTTLILDIEGGEFDFLRENMTALHQLRTIIVEFHAHIDIISNEDACEARSILRNAGFVHMSNRNNVEVWKRL